MKILLVFDNNVNCKELRNKVDSFKGSNVSLFPLGSLWPLINDIKLMCSIDSSAELITSAKHIDEEVDGLRSRIHKWSAELGEYKIAGCSIKKWFLLPKKEVSTWWFSQVSEQNPTITDVFFRLAQLNAIDKIILSRQFDLCIFSVSEATFSKAIKRLCKRHSVKALRISSLSYPKTSFKGYIRACFGLNQIANSLFNAMRFFSICLRDAIITRTIMGPVKGRLKGVDDSVLFVSYFPSVDTRAAENGILRNKYAIPLQEKLKAIKKKIIWIWIYVFIDGHTYKDALTLARRFERNGETNFLIYEFLSFKVLVNTFFLWLRQTVIFFILKMIVPSKVFYHNLSVPEGGIFTAGLMTESFIGRIGLESILYFELYKRIFTYFSKSSHCIYYMEMHAWEKALNAAKGLKAPRMKSIGFQHGGISKNHFFYFHHPDETACSKNGSSLPLPDIVACNGDIPLELMASSGYQGMQKLEAVRHLYMERYINAEQHTFNKENILIVIGSIKKDETKALMSLFHEAFPKAKDFKVWLKGHPSLSFDGILSDLSINPEDCGYTIKNDPVAELLEKAKVSLVVNSTVAIESLAAGCMVIVPIFSDTMDLNNLKGFDRFYKNVYEPQELKDIVTDAMKPLKQDISCPDIPGFISKYFCLDRSLRRWEQVLK